MVRSMLHLILQKNCPAKSVGKLFRFGFTRNGVKRGKRAKNGAGRYNCTGKIGGGSQSGSPGKAQKRVQEKAREARCAARRCPRGSLVQQHADHHRGYRWSHVVLVVRRRNRLQGFAQGHTVRRSTGFVERRGKCARSVRNEELR